MAKIVLVFLITGCGLCHLYPVIYFHSLHLDREVSNSDSSK